MSSARWFAKGLFLSPLDRFFIVFMMYSPRSIYKFMTSHEFRSIMNVTFYKRHMENWEKESPFHDARKILILEWLIDQNYIIAEYRWDHGMDTESYYISTLGNAFLTMYRNSWRFRLMSLLDYYTILWWIAVASMVGSLIANIITLFFIQ